MEYIKDGKVIEASDKAYRSIYKEQGFIPFVAVTENDQDTADAPDVKNDQEETLPEQKLLQDMTVTELKAFAKEKGLGGVSALTKDELLEILKESEEGDRS